MVNFIFHIRPPRLSHTFFTTYTRALPRPHSRAQFFTYELPHGNGSPPPFNCRNAMRTRQRASGSPLSRARLASGRPPRAAHLPTPWRPQTFSRPPCRTKTQLANLAG